MAGAGVERGILMPEKPLFVGRPAHRCRAGGGRQCLAISRSRHASPELGRRGFARMETDGDTS